MPEPSFLFLGAAESLLRFATRFDLREIGGAFTYVKSEDVAAGGPVTAAASVERT